MEIFIWLHKLLGGIKNLCDYIERPIILKSDHFKCFLPYYNFISNDEVLTIETLISVYEWC